MARQNGNVKRLQISEFYCLECKTKIELPRQRGTQRSQGHIKDIYCPCCKIETKHLEIREQDMFDFGIDSLMEQAKEQLKSGERKENVKLKLSQALCG